MQGTRLVGVDVGGTGIKAAEVDLATGELTTERIKLPTPERATPERVAEVVAELVALTTDDDAAPVGVTIPGVVRHGLVCSAANIDDAWIGTDADRLLTGILGRPVHVVNDADAAGYAEVEYGAARGHEGVVMVTTLGTGIGTALISDGHLVPNTELGHLEIDGKVAERFASNAAREREELTWEEWADRLTVYYRTLERLFSPDLFVVGGGVSKHAESFLPLVEIDTEMVVASLGNAAGVVGAALLAARRLPATS